MNAFRIGMVVMSVVAGLGVSAYADDKHAGKAGAHHPGFEKIKALAGEWEAKGTGEHSGTVSYKVTAGGSAVLETLFGGSDHEMVTLYYLEGGDLAMTHY